MTKFAGGVTKVTELILIWRLGLHEKEEKWKGVCKGITSVFLLMWAPACMCVSGIRSSTSASMDKSPDGAHL
jgi:hypothetical protein